MNSGRYEYVRYSVNGIEYYLEIETQNYYEESGYYVMHAQDSLNSKAIDIVLPDDEYLNVIFIPYDNLTELRIIDRSSMKTYSASGSMGQAEITIQSRPDSSFGELTGSFSGHLVNVEDETDTLKVSDGYFIFLY